ncbi:MAG: hypothetical protein V4631_16525 [Pseudomonadota bacterium]
MDEASLLRLHLLRAMYLLIVVGLGLVLWPGIIHHTKPWGLMQGAVNCMLAAFSLLSLLGLRYPLQMLPVLLWELLWKTIWLLIVALPAWSSGQMDADTAEMLPTILVGMLIPFVIPWRHVFTHYLRKPAERWRAGEGGPTAQLR